jgi:hypothetical protein
MTTAPSTPREPSIVPVGCSIVAAVTGRPVG